MSDLRSPFPWFGLLPDNIASKIGAPVMMGYKTPCWPWLAATTNGYGAVQHDGKVQRAHRVIRSLLKGPIPDELQPDHLCRNRGCVNPDPPYADEAERTDDLYSVDDGAVAHEVRKWAIQNGNNPELRIALCGYEGEHAMPDSWDCVAWKARGGYGSQGENAARENAARERIWFSPACLNQGPLFRDKPEEWMAQLGAQDLLKENVLEMLEERKG